MTPDHDASPEPAPPELPAPAARATNRASETSQALFWAALVAGPVAAVFFSYLLQSRAYRAPTTLFADPVSAFLVLFNLFFCLPYLTAYAFAFTRRDPADRAHVQNVVFAMLTFGTVLLWSLSFLLAR